MLNFQQKEKILEKYLKILRECPLFARIEEDKLIRMLHCLGARIVSFDKKQSIFEEGIPAKSLGIILSGSAQIIQIDYYGNRNIISNISKGEVFGEAFACAEVSSLPITVVANEPCEVMLIDCGHILHTCENSCIFHQDLIFNLMKNLATKTIIFHQKIEITSKRTTRDKLLTYLMHESKKANSSDFYISFDRQELADYLEVDRSGLSAEIGKLRKEGILKSDKKHFVLL